MLNEIERWWVSRARQLSLGGHVEARNSRNRFRDFEDLEDPSLCFPGYLGPRYRKDEGVMVVASVHRNFDSGGMVDDPGGLMAAMVEATRVLQSEPAPGDAAGQAYLEAVRPAYESGLGPGGWTVGAHIERVYKQGITETPDDRQRLVYLNMSCGQYPEPTRGRPYPPEAKEAGGGTKTNMQRCCNRAHPLTTVVRQLRPKIIIAMSSIADGVLRKAGATAETPTVYIHPWENKKAKLMRAVTLAGVEFKEATPTDEWLPKLREHLRS